MKLEILDRSWLRALGRLWMATLLLSLAPGGSAQTASTNAPRPRVQTLPNIILIVAEDVEFGDLGCYGQQKIKTPNIDRLAGEGILFTDFYAGSPAGASARAALMTGRHSGHASIRGNGQADRQRDLPLLAEEQTVAQTLKAAGYRTGLIGEWGLGDEGTSGVPDAKGFEEVFGILNLNMVHEAYPATLWRHDPDNKIHGFRPVFDTMGAERTVYINDFFTTAAGNFVRIHQPDYFNRFGPFFLYLAYTAPKLSPGSAVLNNLSSASENWPAAEKNKAARITQLDSEVGQLLEKLKSLKMEEQTAIFLTSARGPGTESDNDPKFFNSSSVFRNGKTNLYEGALRAPMIVRWPGVVAPKQVSDFPWAMWDFLPTAAAMAKTAPPANLDGMSIVPLLTTASQMNRHEFFYWESHEKGFQQAVRMGNWKAVIPAPGAPMELYDLRSDVAEAKNVVKEHAEVADKIQTYLKTARTDSNRWPVKAVPAGEPKKD